MPVDILRASQLSTAHERDARIAEHQRGVLVSGIRVVSDRVEGVGPADHREEVRHLCEVRRGVSKVDVVRVVLAQIGIADAKLQGVRVVDHILQLVHARRSGAGAIKQVQILLFREAPAQLRVGQDVAERLAQVADVGKLLVAREGGKLILRADRCVDFGVLVAVVGANGVRGVDILKLVRERGVELVVDADRVFVPGVLVRFVFRLIDVVAQLQHRLIGHRFGICGVRAERPPFLVEIGSLIERGERCVDAENAEIGKLRAVTRIGVVSLRRADGEGAPACLELVPPEQVV